MDSADVKIPLDGDVGTDNAWRDGVVGDAQWAKSN